MKQTYGPIGKIFKWYALASDHPLTPADRSEIARRAWDTRGRRADAPTYPPDQPMDASGRPIPIKVATVSEAVTAVLAGKVVELANVQQVSTLLHVLGEMAMQAKAAGQRAPNFDLCRVSVPGTNLFCGSQLQTPEFPHGVPRLEMPQTTGKTVPGSPADALPKNAKGHVNAADAFVNHLKTLGISTEPVSVLPAALLKATQAELVGPEVALMMTNPAYDPAARPIFISSDNYVIDGHHRWAAVVGRDAEDGRLGDSTMNVIRIDAPITEVLHIAKRWATAFGIQPRRAKART